MTRITNARIAGVTFLGYIAAGMTSLAVFGRATRGEAIAERLARIADHPTDVGVIVLLGFIQSFSALVLAVTLWAITRDEDADLAMLGLSCRVAEGIVGGLSVPAIAIVYWLATSTGPNAPPPTGVQALAAYLLRTDVEVPATFFAVGSTLFCYLLLRGRMIPLALAWLGAASSILLVGTLPLRLAGFVRGPITMLMWLPMLVFELGLALWLITKGVAPPARAQVR